MGMMSNGSFAIASCAVSRLIAGKTRVVRAISVSAEVGAGIALAAGAAAQTPPPVPASLQHTQATALQIRPGEFRTEHPTLENLGFEWDVVGDANHNAIVSVKYRRVGDAKWTDGMPLLRLDGEEVISRIFISGFNYVAPNMFSGSIFDLLPDTEYEAQFTMTDPDGVIGQSSVTTRVRTRAEPQPASGGQVYHVYPFGYDGPRQSPSFDGLLAAYFQGGLGGDWYNAAPPRAKPGDVILVHAGIYKDQRYRYGHEFMAKWRECCNTTGTGTYFLTTKGTAEKPIVIKAAGDGEVIFDGDGNYNLFNLQAGDYNYFDGITFRNTEVAILAGVKNIAGSKGLTVKHSKFIDVGIGIHTDFAGSSDFYIADNVFIGRHNPDYLTGWSSDEWMKLPGWKENSSAISQYAVKVYGPGHVVAYNKVRNFHDGIDHATYGDPIDSPRTPPELRPSSIDFYNNDISNMHDNCIEADGAMHNIRVMRNLCVNTGFQPLSLQPVLGGPAYFIRNITYNSPVYGAVKMHENPAGGIFINNSLFSGFSPGKDRIGSNIHLINNVIIGQKAASPVMQMSTFTDYSTSDYNAFGGVFSPKPFEWNSPAAGVANDTVTALDQRSFATLADYAKATGQDAHSVMIGLDAFENVPAIAPGVSLNKVYDGASIDARPKRKSAVVDRGTIVPNITDGFVGRAPDLGAIELGRPSPHYGPRDPSK